MGVDRDSGEGTRVKDHSWAWRRDGSSSENGGADARGSEGDNSYASESPKRWVPWNLTGLYHDRADNLRDHLALYT